jgi:hypothetical protein
VSTVFPDTVTDTVLMRLKAGEDRDVEDNDVLGHGDRC